jgi:glycosyltransferase 2 family protein
MSRDDEIVWRRHPADLARLVASLSVLAVLAILAAVEPEALTNASGDLVTFVGALPAVIKDLLEGLVQVLALAIPLALLGWGLLRRAWRPLAVVVLCLVAAAIVMSLLTGWLDRTVPPGAEAALTVDSWVTGKAFPSAAYLAALSAGVTALTPLLGRRWRRACWMGVAVLAVLRLTTAAAAPVAVGFAIVLGIAAGSLVLLVVGAPSRRLTPAIVAAGLAEAGLVVGDLEEVEGIDRRSFAGADDGGRRVWVTYVGRDERDADLLFRAWRAVRVKGIDDQLSGVRPGQQVAHEALSSFLAAEAGVRVPGVRAVGETDEEDGVLATELVEGTTVAELDPDALADELLVDAWDQARRLHGARIAHRRLSTDQLMVGPDGVTLLGLRWSQRGADDVQLAADVAELLVATAATVGTDRAVAAAARVLPAEALAAALPLMQKLALSPSTRELVGKDKELLPAVRAAVQAETGAEEVELFELERIGVGSLVSAFGFVFLVLVILAFVSNWDDISEALREANWTRLPATVVLAFLTYPAGALSLMGAVLRPLAFGRTSLIMLAQSFLNRFTPMNAGGMAMRVRYLQKGGTDVAVAAAAVGVTSAASGVMQGVLFAVFILWAGQSPGGTFETPDVNAAALVVGAVALAVGLVFAIRPLRRFVVKWFKLGWAKLGGEFRGLGRRPDKLALLFGGAGLSKLFTITCFVASCRALDITLGFADLGFLYLVGSSVGSAVPTPGGVGGVEAALIAVLTGAGVDSAAAAAAVVIFRLVTYWLPVPFGYLCLRYSRRAELV